MTTDTGGSRNGPHETQTKAAQHAETDYLDREVNLLKPSTPFMRDHLKVIWTGFVVWALVTFGPPVLTYLAPELMTSQLPVIGFPAHYFLVGFVTPTSSLVLAFVYSRKRDQLDQRYGIDHTAAMEDAKLAENGETAAADGGVTE